MFSPPVLICQTESRGIYGQKSSSAQIGFWGVFTFQESAKNIHKYKMSTSKISTLFAVICALGLVSLSQAAINDTIAELDQKVLDKQVFPNLKQNAAKAISNLTDELRGLNNDWVQARTETQVSYGIFFNARQECEGLDATLDIIGAAPALPQNDFCLEKPINPQAKAVFGQKFQLSNLQGQVKYLQSVVDEQVKFNDDVFKELVLYTQLREIAYGPLQKAVKAYQDCMKQFYSSSNPEPAQCQPLSQKISEKEAIYGKYRTKEVSFGMSTKTPIFSLQFRQRDLSTAQEALKSYSNGMNPGVAELQVQQVLCQQNVDAYRSDVNAKLLKSLNLANKIAQKVSGKKQLFAAQDDVINKAQAATAYIKQLASKIKAAFP